MIIFILNFGANALLYGIMNNNGSRIKVLNINLNPNGKKYVNDSYPMVTNMLRSFSNFCGLLNSAIRNLY